MEHVLLLRGSSARGPGEATTMQGGGAAYVAAAPFESDFGVVLLTDEAGWETPHARTAAHLVASFGFTVVMPDLFAGRPWDGQSSRSAWAEQHPREAVVARVEAALGLLGERAAAPLRAVAAVGFGYGGELAVHLAVAQSVPVDACAAFYPTRMQVTDLDARRVPLLVLLGELDQVVGELMPELVQGRAARRAAVQTAQLRCKTFYDQGHGFADRDVTDEYIAIKAYNTLSDWLFCELQLVSAATTPPWNPDAEREPAPADGQWWPQGPRGVFHNVGYEGWGRTRATWRLHRRPRPPQAPVADEHQLMLLFGAHKITRQVELPQRVALSQMIRVLNEVWEDMDQ